MKFSLKNKLVLAFFLFTVIPLIALGAVSYFITSSSMKSSVEQQITAYSNDAAKSVNDTVSSLSEKVEMMSLDNKLASVASGNSQYSSEVYQYLNEIQKKYSSKIELLAITDASGKEILNNQNQTVNIDLSGREYVKAALEGKSLLSEVMVSKTTGKTVTNIAYPLKVNDKIVGTVLGSIKLENICADVSKIKIGSKGYAYMVDKSGLIVYHPDSTKVLKEKISDLKNDQLNALFDNAKNGKSVQGYYTYNGEKKFVTFTTAKNWIIGITADYNECMASAIEIQRITILMIILGAAASIILAYFVIANKITNPIKKLEGSMTVAGNGDFTVKSEIYTGDELQVLGEYFNKMVESQNNIITNIRGYADELAASSEEISASSEETSAATQEIAANIQEVAESAERQNSLIIEISQALVQLSSLVQIAQNKSVTAREKSEHTMNTANLGRNKVEKTVEAIQNISKATDETESVLMALEELSKKVNGIIITINTISEQTNLLALNAAIEAARAGEHGKGFTVVADEVRKLSEETNQGANEISSLINEMTMQIQKAVESMGTGKEAVEKGVIVANDTDKSFISIISAVEEVVKHIEQIADVTNDETASSDKIVKLIDSVATITETTSASSEQVAAAAEEQTATIENVANGAQQTCKMAEDMDNLIRKFKVRGDLNERN